MIDRIKRNEEKLDKIIEALNELEISIDRLDSIKIFGSDVNKYYGSKNWFKDKKKFENGKIKGIKAGILSEDTVWNTLERINENTNKLCEIRDNIFKD